MTTLAPHLQRPSAHACSTPPWTALTPRAVWMGRFVARMGVEKCVRTPSDRKSRPQGSAPYRWVGMAPSSAHACTTPLEIVGIMATVKMESFVAPSAVGRSVSTPNRKLYIRRQSRRFWWAKMTYKWVWNVTGVKLRWELVIKLVGRLSIKLLINWILIIKWLFKFWN